MRPFGLPTNPRPQSRPLTQVVTDTRLPTWSLSSLNRANAINRRHTTDTAARPVTPSSSLREPKENSNAVLWDSPAIIDLYNGGEEQRTTETTSPSTASSSVLTSTGNTRPGLRGASQKDELAALLSTSDAEQSRALYESFPRIFTTTRARGGGFRRRHTLDKASNAPLGRLLRTPLQVCDICRGHASAVDNDVSSFLRNLYQPENASTESHSAPIRSTFCCSATICDRCYVQAITLSTTRDFWFTLDRAYWIRCPSTSCSSRYRVNLPYTFPDTLPDTLSDTLNLQVFAHVVRYAQAMLRRDALQELAPSPAESALHRAAELHGQLVLHNRMNNPINHRHPMSTDIRMLPVDSADGSRTLQVPIFVDLIVPSQTGGRDCIVCTDTLRDVTDGTPKDEDRWATAISGFPGDWTHLIRLFMPPNSLPTCSATHDLDICRNCLSRHLKAQLESRGRACVESLTCPHPECGHVYTQEEVRKILDPETFARYDKLCLLSTLATLPNFRWCLREGCEFGQEHVFRTPALPSFPAELNLSQRNRVVCEECGFAMCFAHQTPWHEGRDCIEFGYDGAHLAASQAWLREHTKDCPRCGVPMERQGGCFHMTCSLCSHEFCWLCLADWTGIVVGNPITYVTHYRRDGHAVGCYFRREDAPEARMIAGLTLEDALENY